MTYSVSDILQAAGRPVGRSAVLDLPKWIGLAYDTGHWAADGEQDIGLRLAADVGSGDSAILFDKQPEESALGRKFYLDVDFIRINGEVLSVVGAGASQITVDVKRTQWGTDPEPHASGDEVYFKTFEKSSVYRYFPDGYYPDTFSQELRDLMVDALVASKAEADKIEAKRRR